MTSVPRLDRSFDLRAWLFYPPVALRDKPRHPTSARWSRLLIASLVAASWLSRAAEGQIYYNYNSPNAGQIIPGTSGITPEPGVDLSGWNTPGHQLDFANFNYSSLAGSSFANSDLRNASFYSANLANANLADSNLDNASLAGANLMNANLAGAQLPNSDVSSASLAGANLMNANLAGARLAWSDLSKSNLAGCNLTGASFASIYGPANVSNADFAGAIVKGTDFVRIIGLTAIQLYSTASYGSQDLGGIGLEYLDLSGWNFANQNVTGANFTYSALSNATFNRANLTAADLNHTALTNVDFSNANLTNANLSSADLTNASFTGATINGANFGKDPNYSVGITPEQLHSTASYARGDLTGVKFDGRSLENWSFASLNLTNSSFVGSDLLHTDFHGANLTNANFAGSYLAISGVGGADFTNAIVNGSDFGILYTGSYPSYIGTGLTAAQLSSTASYARHDLARIGLENTDLVGWDLSNQNLTGANLGACYMPYANLTNAILVDANLGGTAGTNVATYLFGATVKGADFGSSKPADPNAVFHHLTFEQLSSTASFGRDLSGIGLENLWLDGWDLSNQNLRGANFSGAHVGVSFKNANLAGAKFAGATLGYSDFTGADLRGATGWRPEATTNVRNTIYSDGWIHGLVLNAYDTLIVRNNPVPVKVSSTAILRPTSTLQFVLSPNWTSPVNFAPGVTPLFQGTLDLVFADGIDPSTLIGRSFRLFNLSNPLPANDRFASVTTGYYYNVPLDLSKLYTIGTIRIGPGNYSHGDWSGANFSGLDLVGSNFTKAKLTNASFAFANLTDAVFTNAIINGANFDLSNLTARQLYSTVSYKEGNISDIVVRSDNLTGWNFANQNVSNVDFVGATLTRANFKGAIINGADFSGGPFGNPTGLTATQLYSTSSYARHDLSGIRIEQYDLSGWNFSHQDLSGAVLRSNLTAANFNGAIVRGADFGGDPSYGIYGSLISAQQLYSTASYNDHDLRGIKLDANDLTKWNFSGQNLSNADLSNSILTNAKLSGATVQGASFTNSRGLTTAQFYSTASYASGNLARISLAQNDLAGWNFSSQKLVHATFSNSNLQGANFSNANLAKATFSGTDASGSRFDHANLSNADLASSNLTQATFSNANLRNADLIAANLTQANFANADLSGADLRGANGFSPAATTVMRNAIQPDGSINLKLRAGDRLTIHSAYPSVFAGFGGNGARVGRGSTLQFIFDSNGSNSTLYFGSQPVLEGKLDLEFASNANPSAFVGDSFQLFDFFSGGAPTAKNRFSAITTEPGLRWDTSKLYSDGTVTLDGAVSTIVSGGNVGTQSGGSSGTGTGTLTLNGPSGTPGGTTTLNNRSGRSLVLSGAASTFSTAGNGSGTLATIDGGTLKFNSVAGLPSVGTGVTANVGSTATLELAGSVSALSSGANRVTITNNSNSTGLLVSGTNQQVGNIDGPGNTQVNAGSDLTANDIIPSALVIGGTAGSRGLVTFDASDSSGNPLGQPNGFALAGSLLSSGPFGAGSISPADLSGVAADSTDLAVSATANSVGIGNASQVPEPSTLLLALLAVLGVVSTQFARHDFRWQTV
jgi:uncharacterized protein YjbI with pentapeptide repeats